MLQKLRRIPIFEPLFYIGKSENVKRYRRIRKELEQKDRSYATAHPELIPLHKKLNKINRSQMEEWDSIVYCDGYFYQGFEKIGITGIKPTEKRIEKYQIENYFDSDKTVLDIGCNAGFIACHLAEHFKSVDGIELNPYLVEMGRETMKFLDLQNVNFINGDFIEYDFDKEFDVIFSLSNHFTIDGNLNLDFESYIEKIFRLMNKEGVLFFESHNIDGDDSDLEDKFELASKYFELVDHKMVSSFQKPDIDKLFAVFKRRDEKGNSRKLNFNLEEARKSYQFLAEYA